MPGILTGVINRRSYNRSGWRFALRNVKREVVNITTKFAGDPKAVAGHETIVGSNPGNLSYRQLKMATVCLPGLMIQNNKTGEETSREWLAKAFHMWRCKSVMLVYKWEEMGNPNLTTPAAIKPRGFYIDRRPDYSAFKTEEDARLRGLKFHAMRPFRTLAIKFKPVYSRPAAILDDPITKVSEEDEDVYEDDEAYKILEADQRPIYEDIHRPEGNTAEPTLELHTEMGSWNLWRHMPTYINGAGSINKFQYIYGPHLLFVNFVDGDKVTLRIFTSVDVKGRNTSTEN